MPMLDENLDECRKLFDNNVFAPIALTLAFAPLTIKSKGCIVFIHSSSGYLNVPYMGTYGASKRAFEIMAETLRVELDPFGVRVLSVIGGVVKTMGQTYFEDLALPETSLYKPVEKKFLAIARGENPFPKAPADVFAEKVLRDALSGAKGRVWHGAGAGFLKALSGWALQRLTDWMLSKDCGIYDLYEKKR